ncbi:extracellular catalytic domain type 1 short-chain-length polyhydroxyalkanoate depolymerase [Catenulispora subtropica]|uniref:Esterase, PHB depolymerase family n=1 Tax=Catenulispora subtropica TaxID=450798 RepID=A0ABN2RFP7_9ACTN
MRSGRRIIAAVLAMFTYVAAAVSGAVAAPEASAASLVQVTNFGYNPTNLQMYEYVPASVQAHPPILLALHNCTGSGPAFYSGTEFASLADRYGFIVVYPSVTRSYDCWDVSSPSSLTHNGANDPAGLISMIQYIEQHDNGDASRVYVTGASSGGMATNVMLGDYPDVFKAGAAFMGVPFGCFATTDGSQWNSACAQGQITKTPQQWGDLVRAAYPGYTGVRPRMQLWHGTDDTTLSYVNFGEEIKQWTNVTGVSQTPSTTDHPQSGWTHTTYANSSGVAQVDAYSIANTGHSLPMSGMAAVAVHFFGLDQSGGGGDTTPPSVPSNLAVTGVTSSSVALSWSPSADDVGVAGYRVYRNGVQVGTSAGTAFTDSGLSASTQYSYQVAAYDAAGNVSAQSSAVTATTSSGGGGGGGCAAAYSVTSQWNNGFTASVTVTNNGTAPSTGWKVTWTWGGGQQITNVWNGVLAGTGAGAVTITNAGYNGSIAPGGNTSFGFQATFSGTNASPTLSCTTS